MGVGAKQAVRRSAARHRVPVADGVATELAEGLVALRLATSQTRPSASTRAA